MLRWTAIAAMILAAPAMAATPSASSGFKLSYLYDLASFSGVYRGGASGFAYDSVGRELLLIGNGVIRAYDANGMEVFQFGDDVDTAVGAVVSAAAADDGSLLVLSYEEGRPVITRRNFRGEVVSRLEPKGVPAEHRGWGPNLIRYARGHVYLVNTNGMRCLELDGDGAFIVAHDLRSLIESDDHDRNPEGDGETEINGFDVDADGTLLFVVASRFRAYAVSPDGKVRSWGRPGGAPGRFNIVVGVSSDEANYYVLDTLKGAVIVFDKQLNLLGEFGGYGKGRGQLEGAANIMAGGGRVYVGQLGGRGVAVYQVSGGQGPRQM